MPPVIDPCFPCLPCLQVDFGTTLDLSPYLSKRPTTPALYDLYGVLVHSGHSVHSGHYYCFVRSGTGMWHVCDDTHVQQVGACLLQPLLKPNGVHTFGRSLCASAQGSKQK